MASHFKWYPSSEDRVVPWNATYEFPTEANKSVKMVPRIPPKNGSTFTPGNTIRLEFPAQGYVNPANTTISFDVELDCLLVNGTDWEARFQNNIQSIFSRIRLMYGSTPLEDLIQAGVLTRQLTEWTSSNSGVHDQTSVAEGVGGTHTEISSQFEETPSEFLQVSTRQNKIHGIAKYFRPTVTSAQQGSDTVIGRTRQIRFPPVQNLNHTFDTTTSNLMTTEYGKLPVLVDGSLQSVTLYTPSGTGLKAKRRYQISLPLGLFQQGKLIPTKFMASQLAIELTLDLPENCIIFRPLTAFSSIDANVRNATTGAPQSPFDTIGNFLPAYLDKQFYSPATGTPTYTVSNVSMIPEILEMDASYDAYFLKGLQSGGVPIQMSSWHTFVFAQGKSSSVNLQIQERSRSVKSIFAIVRLADGSIKHDMGATFGDIGASIQSYQFRIGGRYFPASPVICNGFETGGSRLNTGCVEPFIELQKALGTMGDARLSTSINSERWNLPLVYLDEGVKIDGLTTSTVTVANYPQIANASDGFYAFNKMAKGVDGSFSGVSDNLLIALRPGTCDGSLSSIFCMATNLETTNGREISGLNAEEQSDISLNIKWSGSPNSLVNFNIEVYTYFDQMIVLRENNVVELIQ